MDVSAFRSRLVDLGAGAIRREVFSDQSVFERERDLVFARSWLFVGHVTQIPKPGDFFPAQDMNR